MCSSIINRNLILTIPTYIPIEEEIISNLNNEEVYWKPIGNVVVDRVGFKDVESTLVAFYQILEQRPTNVRLLYNI
jgi:hypothetical protein